MINVRGLHERMPVAYYTRDNTENEGQSFTTLSSLSTGPKKMLSRAKYVLISF